MAYNFPSNPVEDQEFTPPVGGQTYVYKAPRWLVKGIPPVAGGGAGGGGGGIPEAPEDGKQYTREVASWKENSWAKIAGKPATFPPTVPIALSDVTGTDTLVPPGAIMYFARSTAPTGWLKANGALVSRTTYANLFAAIGTTFGVGDGGTTFAIPDLRGEFIRAWDDARGIDAGRVLASIQLDGVKSHTHTYSATSGTVSVDHSHAVSGGTGYQSADHAHHTSGTTSGFNTNHSHTFSDASSATGAVSANHTHAYNIYGGSGADTNLTGRSGDATLQATLNTGTISANHTHTVAVSGTTSGANVDHSHTFAAWSGGVNTNHTHAISFQSGGISANHTHTVSGTSDANAAATTENRPRNIALLACIKY